MSYILDALQKAERERQGGRVPTLHTAHGGPEQAHRPPWLWAVVGVLALSAAALYFFWTPGRPDAIREASLAPESPKAAVASPPVPAAPTAPVSNADQGPTPSALERAPKREDAAPGLAPGVSVGRPSGGADPERPRVAPATPRAKAPPAGRTAEDPQRAPSSAGSAVAPETRAAAVQPRPLLPTAAPDVDPIPEPRPGGGPVAPPAVARPAPAEPLLRLTLDVLVYSDVPVERLVFINGRKYVEGQTLDGDAVVEQITPDGAILRHQGKQFLLRPKLNPYARPGSP